MWFNHKNRTSYKWAELRICLPEAIPCVFVRTIKDSSVQIWHRNFTTYRKLLNFLGTNCMKYRKNRLITFLTLLWRKKLKKNLMRPFGKNSYKSREWKILQRCTKLIKKHTLIRLFLRMSRKIVLLNCGSFNPPHSMHLR